MPLPLGPVVSLALRYGAVAAIGALAVRKATPRHEHKNAAHEASFNQVDDGLKFYRTENLGETQYHAEHGKWHQIWLGRHGFEIDTRALARLRIRKVKKD